MADSHNRYFALRFIVEMKADEQRIISVTDKLNAAVYRVLHDAGMYPRRQVLAAFALDEGKRRELDEYCDRVWTKTILEDI
jgi:hypothetical protein